MLIIDCCDFSNLANIVHVKKELFASHFEQFLKHMRTYVMWGVFQNCVVINKTSFGVSHEKVGATVGLLHSNPRGRKQQDREFSRN